MTKQLSLLFLVFLSWASLSFAQPTGPQVNPSDLYFKAYLYERDGTKLIDQGKYDEGVEKFNKAQSLVHILLTKHSTWRTDTVVKVNGRLLKHIQSATDKKLGRAPVATTTQPSLYGQPTSQEVSAKRSKERAAEKAINDKKLAEISAKLAKVEEQLKEAESKKSQPEINNEELLRQLNAKEAEIQSLKTSSKTDKESALIKETNLKNELDTLKRELSQQNSTDKSLQSNYRVALSEKTQEITTLESRLKKVQSEQDLLLNDSRKSRKASATAQAALASLQKKNKELTQKLSQTEDSHKNESSQLAEKITLLQQQLKTADSKSDNTKIDVLEKVQTELEKTKSELADLQTKKASSEKQFLAEQKALKAEKAANEKSVKKLEADLKKSTDLISAASEKELTNSATIKTLTEDLEGVKQSQAATLAKLDQSQSARVQLQQEMISLRQERDILLLRPLRSEVEVLQEDLKVSKIERETLSKNISENETKYYSALDRIDELQVSLTEARKASSQLEENMQEERETASDVMKSQRERLAQSQNELAETQRSLALEQKKFTELELVVNQSKALYSELKEKHDGLVAERDQLVSLLNGDSDVNVLKQQNIELQRELRAARNDFKKKLTDETTEKEDLLIAKKKYAVLRTELIKTKHELELSELKSEKLMTQLEKAQNDLKIVETSEDSEYSSEEVTMLKEIINQNVEVQKNRQRARSLILEEVKRLGIDDTNFLAALDLAEVMEHELSDAQKQLLGNKDADGEFRFADRASPEQRARAEKDLNQRLEIHSKLGRNAFEKGRYAAAEEIFQQNIDAHPGHIPSMINLGTISLRKAMKDRKAESFQTATQYFEDALAMSVGSSLPYAHQMLGNTYYQQGKYEEATEFFFSSLAENPANAVAHVFLGSIFADLGDLKASETHFLKSLEIDATLVDPSYNLAVIHINQGKYSKALQQYREARKKGLAPDRELEAVIESNLPNTIF